MINKTAKKKSRKAPLPSPVIYVHARGHAPLDSGQAQSLAALGLTVCTHMDVEGAEQTTNGYGQLGALLAELGEKYPERPVIVMRAGLQPTASLLTELARLAEQAAPACVLVPLSNAAATVNPFAGLHAETDGDEYDLAGLVSLLAPGQLYPLADWPDHFTWYSADAVHALASAGAGGAVIQQLAAAGIQAMLTDQLFVRDPCSAVFTNPDSILQADSPPPFAVLSARLQAWFDKGIEDLPVQASGAPATLHVTHSWGGGVAQWIDSFIDADDGHRHFQLSSESANSKPPFGLKLSLYGGSELRCPIATWWLQPPIGSLVDSDPSIAQILPEICRRFNIGRIFVSSLIGHSLDVLRTGLPTLQVLHDHFPLWPLLGINPEPYLSERAGADLARALQDHQESRTFLDLGAASWAQLGAAYLKAMTDHGVKVAVPGQWVADLQQKIEPGFAALDSTVIPHGFPNLVEHPPIKPKPRRDGRLRMVILGRAQEGKGVKLLLNALPRLAEHVQVYLLGTGRPGQAFFGIPGVDVVLEYDRDELGSLLETIGPDFAALLSVVPETFSYTLSELQQLGIPAIATRVGSFPHRIEHNRTGWLVDADADALVQQVIGLCNDPGALDKVRKNLPPVAPDSPSDMVKAYNRLCPPAGATEPYAPDIVDSAQAQMAAAGYQALLSGARLRKAAQAQKKLARDVTAMAAWAKKEQRVRKQWVRELEAELEKERKIREQWVSELEAELEKERKIREDWVAGLEQELRAEQERHARLTTELQQTLENTLAGLQHVQSELELKHQELQAAQTDLQHERADLHSTLVQLSRLQANYRLLTQTLDDLRASASWRVTAPFRAVRRTAANLMLARAWNPLRWPWLAANMIRNLHGLGFAGTLHRMQASRAEDMPAPTRMADSLPPAPDAAIPGQAPAHFPRHQSPDASIVIPVYNQWTYTAACLASLRSARSRHTFEVIVVDDQSSDETSAELAGIHGITTLRNEENLGFLGSCNRGAWHARGRFLVLLNNDTQVTDGWLDELVDTFTAQPEAGLVGARLVYPDGRLQESGGIIYNDASGWNYGRDDVADRPEYEFLREADYVSGACIALRTSLFRELGGLDERYAPAYYEDTDLAFRIRGAGLKVFVQPSSVVVHHEGITSGTDTSSGTKRFQVINRQKFLERWQAELANQPEPITDHSDPVPVRRATRHRQAGRVLFIDAFTPKPDRDSGSLRLLNLMRLCKDMGYGVTFLPDNLAYADRYTRVLQKAGIEALYNPWIVSLDEYFAARGGEFDFIVISRYYVASNYVALLRRLCPNASFIFDTVDLHYLRERRQAEFEGSTALKFAARQTRRAELAVIREADATLVVSPDEQALLAEDAPGSEVHLVSNIHEVPGRNGEFADRNDIYFVGAYRHPPNVDAACWFVNEIWPLVRAELPGVRFHLIGNDAPDEVRSLQGDGVVFHGYVESLQPFLDGCRLAVAPLRFGAGVKGKVNMSMAHGQPVVATPIAAEGLFVEHEKECLLAGDAESFAREVIRLYQDEALWRKLSDASARNVEEHFSMAAARDRLAALFDALAVQQGVSAD